MKIDRGTLTFSDGTTYAFWSGMVGINPDMEIGAGYDEIDPFRTSFLEDGDYTTCKLTSAQRVELADYMIRLWEQFKHEPRDKHHPEDATGTGSVDSVDPGCRQ